jgi:hypothetical protein
VVLARVECDSVVDEINAVLFTRPSMVQIVGIHTRTLEHPPSHPLSRPECLPRLSVLSNRGTCRRYPKA